MMCLMESVLSTVEIPNRDATMLETVLLPVPEVPPSRMISGALRSVRLRAMLKSAR
jgi:hypothetical protein